MWQVRKQISAHFKLSYMKINTIDKKDTACPRLAVTQVCMLTGSQMPTIQQGLFVCAHCGAAVHRVSIEYKEYKVSVKYAVESAQEY